MTNDSDDSQSFTNPRDMKSRGNLVGQIFPHRARARDNSVVVCLFLQRGKKGEVAAVQFAVGTIRTRVPGGDKQSVGEPFRVESSKFAPVARNVALSQ